MEMIETPLLWFCALGCDVMAGVYFAFSTFIITALARIDASAGVAAMNSINVVILRSAFMPLFFGTTLACVALVVIGCVALPSPRAYWLIAGGLAYVLGMFVVTMARNVPLNDALASAGAAGESARGTWENYLRAWTPWNHVRTLASLMAAACFTAAI